MDIIAFVISANPLKDFRWRPCELVWDKRYYYLCVYMLRNIAFWCIFSDFCPRKCVFYRKKSHEVFFLRKFCFPKSSFVNLQCQNKVTSPNPRIKNEIPFCHKKVPPRKESGSASCRLDPQTKRLDPPLTVSGAKPQVTPFPGCTSWYDARYCSRGPAITARENLYQTIMQCIFPFSIFV